MRLKSSLLHFCICLFVARYSYKNEYTNDTFLRFSSTIIHKDLAFFAFIFYNHRHAKVIYQTPSVNFINVL